MSQATMGLSVSNPTVSQSQVTGNSSISDEHVYDETVIRPKKGWIGVDWAEIVKHRELLYFLVWRDVKVKYKQAIFGPVWAIVVPLVSVLIYSLIGQFAGFASRTR